MTTEHETRAHLPRANGADHPPEKILLSRGRRLPPLRRFDDDVVAEVRRRVTATSEPLVRIAADTGVAQTTILRWMREKQWERPESAPPARVVPKMNFAAQREKLMTRLYRALGLQLEGIERRGRDAGDGEMTEKDARALGIIAKTLDTLSALDRDDGGMKQEPELFDRGTVEAGLAEKIRRWAEGGR